MKNIIFKILALVFISFCMIVCEEKEAVQMPRVQTESVQEIFANSAKVGGKVTFDGGSEITERGIFWGTLPGTDTSGTKLALGAGLGIFETTLTGLIPGTKYYVNAFAINSGGMVLGTETFFTTQIFLPVVNTLAVSEVTPTSATIGGEITDDGGHEITARGVYWGIEPNAKFNGTLVPLGDGIGSFTYNLEGLTKGITYYAIAFATNIKGTAYGTEISFSTESELPTVYTTSILKIATHSATIGGNVASDGGSVVTERGIYWGTSLSPELSGTKWILGSGTGFFSDSLANLIPGTTYYVKAYAINGVATAYGEEKNFVTLGLEPTATTLTQTNITANGVTLMGLVNANDLSTVVTFEYGTTTSYGNSVIAGDSPTTLNNDTLSASITGLAAETIYHFRVIATNELGTVYGGDSTFTTVLTGITGTVNDVEGNSYSTIGIGHQIWMTENLKTTRYNDNSSIFLADADTSWVKNNIPGYCWYNNDADNKDIYGALYNYAAISTNKLCPAGWHVPTNEDWIELVNYLGGASVAGGKLKETGFSEWISPNSGATNEYSFNGLPGGKRLDNGNFDFLGFEANWWSSSNYGEQNAWNLYLQYNYNNSFQGYINKQYGMSIRCVKD